MAEKIVVPSVPPSKPVTKEVPKTTGMDWIRNGFRLPGEAARPQSPATPSVTFSPIPFFGATTH